MEERKCRKGGVGRRSREVYCYLPKYGIYPSKCGSPGGVRFLGISKSIERNRHLREKIQLF